MYECEGKTVPPIDPATIEPEVLAGLMSGLLQPEQRYCNTLLSDTFSS